MLLASINPFLSPPSQAKLHYRKLHIDIDPNTLKKEIDDERRPHVLEQHGCLAIKRVTENAEFSGGNGNLGHDIFARLSGSDIIGGGSFGLNPKGFPWL